MGQPDAAQLIAATALADPPTPLWISRAAQQAILAAAEQGVSAREGRAEQRILTLIDATNDISVGVASLAQLQTLAHTMAAEAVFDAALSVTPAILAELARQGADLDLLAMLRQVLGSAEEITVALGD